MKFNPSINDIEFLEIESEAKISYQMHMERVVFMLGEILGWRAWIMKKVTQGTLH